MAVEKRKTPPARTRKKVYGDKHIIGYLFSICLLLNLFLGTVLYGLVWLKIPDIKTVVHYQPMQTTYILGKNDEVIERIFVENRTVVPLSKMPPLLGKAFVAAEDGSFFDHPGLDFLSVLRAAVNNLREGRRGQGGSTITQQVAKSLLLTPEKTYLRKFKEAILAWRIDTLLTKDEILYIYMNQIYLGGGAHGVEAASQVYFDKHVWQLNLAEIAILAGLPQAPSRYSPLKHPERAIARQKYVLNRMAADGYITRAQAKKAYETALVFGERGQGIERKDYGYYTQVVKKLAEEALAVPLTRAAVTIHTHMDVRKQRAAVAAIAAGSKKVVARTGGKAPQGALVSMDGCSGKVRALAGGTDYVKYPYNRAFQAKRPAGSVFKPLVYASALTLGWQPGTYIADSPLAVKGGDGKIWRPKNFSGTFHGRVTLLEALIRSYNIPAIRLLQSVGVKSVHDIARKSGINAKLTPDLSLALGTVDVSPVEMTAAYTPYICGGSSVQPRFIEYIQDSKGQRVYVQQKKARLVIPGNVAAQMKFMLKKVVQDGTGKRVQGLSGETGGKTGTTNGNRDAWFIGFNDRLLTGVWMGHDRNQSLGKRENGGKTSSPVWLDYMKRIQ